MADSSQPADRWWKDPNENAGAGPPLPKIEDQPDQPNTQEAPKKREVLRLAPREEMEAKAKARAEELTAMAPDTAPDERVLLELAAAELELLDELRDAQLQMALRVGVLLDNPDLTLKLAQALKNTSFVANAVAGRVRESLLTASTLRAQRRLVKGSAR